MTKLDPQSRYIIGIDLGTTNCALAYVDTAEPDPAPKSFLIDQWEMDGATLRAETLPSFYYLPVKAEWKKGQYNLPWHIPAESPCDFVVGRLARERVSQVPGRVIHSAKSWLSHSGVDRRERILPWHSDDIIGDERRSPIEVSAGYLRHLREAWNYEFRTAGDASLFEAQEIVITVPASFDEVAQRLTLEAALLAGYPTNRIRLLEEPQAAFYDWLGRHKNQLDQELRARGKTAQTILVCDIGGGTTDFSLLSVDWSSGDAPVVTRTGVSDHLLLGGDNIDLSLAHMMERKLLGEDRSLSSRQWAQLVFEARHLKEKSLQYELNSQASQLIASEALYVSVAGEGSSLFASTMTVSLTPAEVQQHVIDGFFPFVGGDARPERRRAGLAQLGLPYAVDSAVTKHLAAFVQGQKIDAILFAGGTVKSSCIRDRIIDQVAAWQGHAPFVLTSDAMDLAISLGAAEYGLRQRPDRRMLKVGGGYPRSLYVEAASPKGIKQLVCVVPKGFPAGERLVIKIPGLKARTNRLARFRLYSSVMRPHDKPGDVLSLDLDTMHALPSLDAKLETQESTHEERLVDVALDVELQSTGILDISCQTSAEGCEGETWRLEFSLKPAEVSSKVAPTNIQECSLPPIKVDLVRKKLDEVYGKKRKATPEEVNPKNLVRDLEQTLGVPREQWDTAFLRSIWPHLEQGLTRRNRSLGHELSWLYLAGYALRPGYGFELDEWRVKELWRAYEQGLAFPKERAAEEQWWIMWRRVAGGLTKLQQEQIFDRIFPQLRKGETHSAEVYMLAGSLERVDMIQKVRLGQQLVQQIKLGKRQHLDQKIWALARISTRVPLYAESHAIIRPRFIESWAEELAGLHVVGPPFNRLVHFYAQSGRVVCDREFDISQSLRQEFLKRLTEGKASEEVVRPVKDFVPFEAKDRSALFGETLPSGLWLEG